MFRALLVFHFVSPFPKQTNKQLQQPYKYKVQLQNSRYSNYTVLLEIDAGFYRLFEVVQVTANICNVGSLDYMGRRLEGRRIEEYEYDDNEQEEDGGNGGDDYYGNRNGACPLLREGPYQFYTAFTVPDFLQNDGDSSNQMDFTPDLQLKFYDESYNRIGCVETGSLAMYAEGQARRKRGQRLFMFAMFVLVISSSVCFMIYRRRRVAKEFKANRNRRRHMRRIHYLHSSSTSQSSGGGGGRILMSPEMSCSESTDAVSHNTPSLHHQHHQAAVYQPPSNHSRAPSSVA